MAEKLNMINRIQKWMDTLAGQTFMNYAYSWGAAVVILGTLFKLLHLSGANLMLCVGMGTEVFVFIVSGFERVTERVSELNATTSAEATAGQPLSAEAAEALAAAAASGPVVVQGGGAGVPLAAAEGAEGAPVVAGGGGTIIIGGGGGGAGAAVAGGAIPLAASGQPISPEALAQGESLSATAANLAAAGQAAAQAQLALSQLQGGSAINPQQISATDPSAIEEAVRNYAEELTELTEVLGRVKAQAARMSTDSEEMENLNRTLTGIATVYELQLRNISKQVSTIEQIDEQTRRMARQIEELNDVYARMIQALTVNMRPVVPPTAESGSKQ
ncbi:MAG: gliding motility protein GldL [Prevotellaceae bacterium]|nr:gliding motility protein GldL [Prevotellaceae bacterium]